MLGWKAQKSSSHLGDSKYLDGWLDIFSLVPRLLLLNNHWQQNVGSHQKNIPHVRGQRRSPSKMVGGEKWHLESSPIPARDAWRAQTKPCAHQDPETPQSLSQTCLWVFEYLLQRHRSAVACCGDRVSGCSRPGRHSVRHKPSWKRLPLAPP